MRERQAEIAEALELTDRTVRRDWDKARLLLGAMLKASSGSPHRPAMSALR